MSLESHLKEFPSGLSMNTSGDTGIRSEKILMILSHSWGMRFMFQSPTMGLISLLTADGHRRLYKLPLGLIMAISVMMVQFLLIML